jgi:uncharacterized delta-60 repeat protein
MRTILRLPALLVVLVGVLVASLGPVATAQAGGAHVIRGFGRDGTRFLPGSLPETDGVALLGGGRVLFAGGKELLALAPTGRIDHSFGTDGYAHLVAPPNASVEGAAPAVDRDGRPVIVGGVLVEPRGSAVLTGSRFLPFLERFTAAGKIDTSFGEGKGYVASSLGLPASADGEPSESFLRHLEFDDAGRLLVTGTSRVDVAQPGGGVAAVGKEFLARFGVSGQLDPGFATGGLFFPPAGESLGTFASVGPGNELTVGTQSESGRSRAVLRLGEGGAPDPGFEADGYVPSPFGAEFSPLAVDPQGRTVAWTYVQGVEHRLANGLRLKRLLPDGAPDPSFGKGGTVTLRIPRFYVADLGFDSRGRVLLAATLKERSPIGEPEDLVLLRLRDDGRLDKSFGDGGTLPIPWPHRKSPGLYLEGMDVRDGRVAISATDCGGACQPTITMVALGSGG